MRPSFNLWVGKIPLRRKHRSTPVFLPGKSHGQRSLVVYSPWSHKGSVMTYGLNHSHHQFHPYAKFKKGIYIDFVRYVFANSPLSGFSFCCLDMSFEVQNFQIKKYFEAHLFYYFMYAYINVYCIKKLSNIWHKIIFTSDVQYSDLIYVHISIWSFLTKKNVDWIKAIIIKFGNIPLTSTPAPTPTHHHLPLWASELRAPLCHVTTGIRPKQPECLGKTKLPLEILGESQRRKI